MWQVSYPLPPNPYPETTVWYTAYDICRQFELSTIEQTIPLHGLSELVCARFLGYMVIEAPNDAGREDISKEILSATGDVGLVDLAKLYIGHFIHFFPWERKNRFTADGDWDPESETTLFFENDIDYTLKYLLNEAPPNHYTAEKKALIRDQFRCMVTRAYDSQSVRRISAVQEAQEAEITRPGPSRGYVIPTEGVHILSEGTDTVTSDTQAGEITDGYAASLSAILERYGQIDPAELAGPAHHRPENIMTLSVDIHGAFVLLDVWFEPTSVPNEYTIGRGHPGLMANTLPHTATFVTLCDELPLPDPRYLALHAACSRVVTLSGVRHYITQLLDCSGIEEEDELRPVDVLTCALTKLWVL